MNIDDERLLILARRLREDAGQAGRTDVVAKVDDVIILLAGAKPEADESKANVVIRILDGLGF